MDRAYERRPKGRERVQAFSLSEGCEPSDDVGAGSAAEGSAAKDDLHQPSCLNIEQQLIVLRNEPGVHRIEPDRMQPLE